MTRTQSVEVHMPRWQWCTVCTVLVVLIAWGVLTAYSVVQGPFEARMAVEQLKDNAEAYAVARGWAAANLSDVVRYVSVGILALVWGPYIAGMIRYGMARREE